MAAHHRRIGSLFSAILVAILVFLGMAGKTSAEILLTPSEQRQVLRFGPWPPEIVSDASNRVSGNEAAIRLGKALFSDPILSRDGAMSCATCHRPDQAFMDGLPRSKGRRELERNTPSLWNVRFHRWFGWGGDHDNLWAQSLAPILKESEMANDPERVKQAIARSGHITDYVLLFGPLADHAPIQVVVNIGKALAAYQETLVTGKTPFDHFRDALAAGDMDAAATYTGAAQRGLKLFLGEGRCFFCHAGPAFTNGEFHDAGVPYFVVGGGVDPGRYAGLKVLSESPFTLDGEYSDDAVKAGAWAVRNVRFKHSDFGAFRVPSLRNVARTAPYMHDGRFSDLASVLKHYNEIDLERLHADGELILAPLGLAADELRDLEAFLESLSE